MYHFRIAEIIVHGKDILVFDFDLAWIIPTEQDFIRYPHRLGLSHGISQHLKLYSDLFY
jgi:hypothetical protein